MYLQKDLINKAKVIFKKTTLRVVTKWVLADFIRMPTF